MINVYAQAAATKMAASSKYTKLNSLPILGILGLLRVFNPLFPFAGVLVKNRSAAKITANAIEQERSVQKNANAWIVRMVKFINTILISNQGWKLKLTLDFLTCIFILLFFHIFMI